MKKTSKPPPVRRTSTHELRIRPRVEVTLAVETIELLDKVVERRLEMGLPRANRSAVVEDCINLAGDGLVDAGTPWTERPPPER